MKKEDNETQGNNKFIERLNKRTIRRKIVAEQGHSGPKMEMVCMKKVKDFFELH